MSCSLHCDKIIRVPLRYTATDFATIPLSSHTLRVAQANLQAELLFMNWLTNTICFAYRVLFYFFSCYTQKGRLLPYDHNLPISIVMYLRKEGQSEALVLPAFMKKYKCKGFTYIFLYYMKLNLLSYF